MSVPTPSWTKPFDGRAFVEVSTRCRSNVEIARWRRHYMGARFGELNLSPRFALTVEPQPDLG
jgi:hypothetical protein